jgi:Ca-dependent carbohydrate-binding module xylan-binding
VSNIRLVIAGTAVVALTLPFAVIATAADTALEADVLTVNPSNAGSVVTDSTAVGGSALLLSRNAAAAKTVDVPASAKIVIRARGRQCLGAPVMNVSVDGKKINTTTVGNSTWTDYPIATTMAAGPHSLSIAYVNDAYLTSACDRNLFVDTITVVGSAPTTTTPTPTSSPPTTATTTPPPTTVPAGSATRKSPFMATSPFKVAIPAGAAVDPNSAAMVARMARDNAMYANLVEFGIPIHTAATATQKYTVTCTITSWGTCPFAGAQVPIPTGAKVSPGSDGAMVVVDEAGGKSYEFWQAKFSNGKWTTSWGAINDLNGSGWGGNSTGSGASRLGGVIQLHEIAAGAIPHALSIQIDNTCKTTFRSPATKTDGQSSRSDCIPEGARVRLDPAVDLDALTLTPAVRAIGRALQTYGAYVVDTGGSPVSLSFEMDPTATTAAIGNTYKNAGLRWDYDGLPGLPYKRLQVLR